MNLEKIANKIASEKVANDASQQYRLKLQSCNFALGELRKALLDHSKKQKADPSNFGYVGDLNYMLSQLNQMIDTFNER